MINPADLIKGKVSPWKQMVHKWRSARNVPLRTKFFVGYDLDGNTFWEFQNYNDPARMRRIVEYRNPKLNYVDYKLPPQWVQWLRHNRPSHPTLQELYADQVRQENLKGLIREADQRWKEVPLKPEYQQAGGEETAKFLNDKSQQFKPTQNRQQAANAAQNAKQTEPGSWNPTFRARGRE